jgi:hypothetical protein
LSQHCVFALLCRNSRIVVSIWLGSFLSLRIAGQTLLPPSNHLASSHTNPRSLPAHHSHHSHHSSTLLLLRLAHEQLSNLVAFAQTRLQEIIPPRSGLVRTAAPSASPGLLLLRPSCTYSSQRYACSVVTFALCASLRHALGITPRSTRSS